MNPKRTRIILDTNLWISFLISKNLSQLDALIFEKHMRLIFSAELLEEFIEVTQRPKFRRFFSQNDVLELLDLIHEYSDFFEVRSSISICRDPKDNFLLSLAVDSKAEYLVTRDNDLLELKFVETTSIVTIADLVTRF